MPRAKRNRRNRRRRKKPPTSRSIDLFGNEQLNRRLTVSNNRKSAKKKKKVSHENRRKKAFYLVRRVQTIKRSFNTRSRTKVIPCTLTSDTIVNSKIKNANNKRQSARASAANVHWCQHRPWMPTPYSSYSLSWVLSTNWTLWWRNCVLRVPATLLCLRVPMLVRHGHGKQSYWSDENRIAFNRWILNYRIEKYGTRARKQCKPPVFTTLTYDGAHSMDDSTCIYVTCERNEIKNETTLFGNVFHGRKYRTV